MTQDAHVVVGGFGPDAGGSARGLELLAVAQAPDGTDAAGTGVSAEGTSGEGLLRPAGLLAELPSPTWVERDGDIVYAALEEAQEIATLRLSRQDGIPRLSLLKRTRTSGKTPTHLAVLADPDGERHLVVACYGDGAVVVHPLESDGTVGDAAQVIEGEGHGPLAAQDGPHAHWVLELPDGRVLTTDLGADRVHVHTWEGGHLRRTASVALPAGTGPRDLHLLPSAPGRWAVAVVGEWGGTVAVLTPTPGGAPRLAGNATGAADIVVQQVVELGADPADQAASLAYVPDSPAPSEEAEASESAPGSASGRAYVALRGSDRLVCLRWDGETLSREAGPADSSPAPWSDRGVWSGGHWPRHVIALGRRLLVANQLSGDVAAFAVRPDGEPVLAGTVSLGTPTVLVPLDPVPEG